MARPIQPDLFATDLQPAARGTESMPAYRPDLDKVRVRLHRILSEARAAETLPWDAARLSLYRTIFPQMIGWLPEKEGKQLRREFETELERLKAA